MLYRIQSTDPADKPLIARFAPVPLSLRGACGVSIDLARHLLGNPRIVSESGTVGGPVVEAEMETVRKHRAGIAEAPGVGG